MDFMRILQSLEEFLYEVMSWLVFYPRALWRTFRHPVAVAVYTEKQLKQGRDQQFTEMVSPPLMLILTVVIAHVIELSSPMGMAKAGSTLGNQLFSSEQGIIATRSVIYCLFALFGAMAMLRRKRLPIDRETLRAPFYIHCYLLAPFVLGLAIMTTVLYNTRGHWPLLGLPIGFFSCIWYAWAQTAIYRRILEMSLLRASVTATLVNITATLVVIGLGLFLSGALQT
jgi:hypothetical protein